MSLPLTMLSQDAKLLLVSTLYSRVLRRLDKTERPRPRGAFYVRCDLPIYEYECNLCSAKFERRQRFDEEPVAACPQCTGRARRVIHSVPVLFKGSGFYSTDHGRRSRDNPGRKDEDTKPTSDTKAKSEIKVETKPEESG